MRVSPTFDSIWAHAQDTRKVMETDFRVIQILYFIHTWERDRWADYNHFQRVPKSVRRRQFC